MNQDLAGIKEVIFMELGETLGSLGYLGEKHVITRHKVLTLAFTNDHNHNPVPGVKQTKTAFI